MTGYLVSHWILEAAVVSGEGMGDGTDARERKVGAGCAYENAIGTPASADGMACGSRIP